MKLYNATVETDLEQPDTYLTFKIVADSLNEALDKLNTRLAQKVSMNELKKYDILLLSSSGDEEVVL